MATRSVSEALRRHESLAPSASEGIKYKFTRLRLGLVLALAMFAGCRESNESAKTHELRQQATQRQLVEQLLNNALGLINDVEHSDVSDLPEQIVNHLNQWIGARKELDDWQVDPLAKSLPPEWQQLEIYGALDKRSFLRIDAAWLQEAVWLRSAARHTAGKINDPLGKAKALFDWTVRQIALESDSPETVPHAAWDTMLLGRGTMVDRLWVFTLLARQQNLDVVVLAVEKGGKTEPWAAGLLHERQLYLFEPELGLPIRTADGHIATLHDAATRPEILTALDVDAEHPYRFRADDFKDVVALIEASPPYLSQRFRQIELRLSGDERLILSVDASSLAEQLKQTEGVARTGLWLLPWERAAVQVKGDADYRKRLTAEIRPFRLPPAHLWKGRVMHLMGRYSGEFSAAQHYQAARPAEADLDLVEQQRKMPKEFREMIEDIKQDATYWLGLLAFERGNYSTAREYLGQRLLQVHPDTHWRSAAHYLIGRSYEAEGNKAEAAAAYGKVTGPAATGARLRGRMGETE